MPTPPPWFTVGVEEEYHVVDAETLALRPRADRILPRARKVLGDRVQPELILSQIEVGTPVCSSLGELRLELVHLRRTVDGAARAEESRIAATGTHPFTQWMGQSVTPKERYERIEEDFQQLAREQMVCGCHVHVAIPDRDAAVRVVDRVRPWLPALLALTANSPFWEGVETGYASYRSEIFGRWPTAGIPDPLGSARGYDEVVAQLVAVGAIPDASFLYWDVRPSTRFPTVEFRVADVCSTVDEAVLVAGLCLGLARRLCRDDENGDTAPPPRSELLRAARWRAARFGLCGTLIDPVRLASRPAAAVLRDLLAFVRDDLEEAGAWDEVLLLCEQVLAGGNGAVRQRRSLARRGRFRDVVEGVVAETVAG